MATKLKGLRLSELSLVDFPANEGAKVTLYKRADPLAVIRKWDEPRARAFVDLMTENEARRRQWEANEEMWPLFTALQDSLSSIVGDMALDSATKTRRAEESINQFLAALREKFPEVEAEVAKALGSAAGKPGDQKVGTKEHSMSDDAKKVADLEVQVADLTKKLEAETAKVTELTKAKEAIEKDEVIKVGETEVRKSVVGDGVFAVIKAQQAEIAKERDAREIAELTKAAETAYGSLPGEPIAKAKALRAVSKLGDEDKAVVEAMLKAGEAAMKAGFNTIGKAGGSIAEGSAEDKLDKLAKAKAEKDGVPFAKAYDEVLKSEDGKRLYNESLNEARAN